MICMSSNKHKTKPSTQSRKLPLKLSYTTGSLNYSLVIVAHENHLLSKRHKFNIFSVLNNCWLLHHIHNFERSKKRWDSKLLLRKWVLRAVGPCLSWCCMSIGNWSISSLMYFPAFLILVCQSFIGVFQTFFDSFSFLLPFCKLCLRGKVKRVCNIVVL